MLQDHAGLVLLDALRHHVQDVVLRNRRDRSEGKTCNRNKTRLHSQACDCDTAHESCGKRTITAARSSRSKCDSIRCFVTVLAIPCTGTRVLVRLLKLAHASHK